MLVNLKVAEAKNVNSLLNIDGRRHNKSVQLLRDIKTAWNVRHITEQIAKEDIKQLLLTNHMITYV